MTDMILAGIAWVVSEGGAMVVSYWVMERVAFLRDMADAELKRVVSFALAGVVAAGLYSAAVGIGALPVPENWITTLVAVIGTAVTGGQLIHGRKKLALRKPA